MFITELLSKGKNNTVTAKDLCNLLDTDPRDVTAAIERERKAGQPICASVGKNAGYYIAANKKEMQEYCNSLSRRLKSIQKTYKACLRSINNLPEEER